MFGNWKSLGDILLKPPGKLRNCIDRRLWFNNFVRSLWFNCVLEVSLRRLLFALGKCLREILCICKFLCKFTKVLIEFIESL